MLKLRWMLKTGFLPWMTNMLTSYKGYMSYLVANGQQRGT
ncbi:MAG: hypothetical protein QOJ40_1128 [Verrucomicrobiota bacterium]